jgi:hypothetical protein
MNCSRGERKFGFGIGLLHNLNVYGANEKLFLVRRKYRFACIDTLLVRYQSGTTYSGLKNNYRSCPSRGYLDLNHFKLLAI